VFRAWAPGDALVPGVWDIPVPLEAAPEVLPDVLLVPMLAFDAGATPRLCGGSMDQPRKAAGAEKGGGHRRRLFTRKMVMRCRSAL